ncbi:alpha/beta-hydrolase [Aspergillus keveii]|uniref:Alpha/beta-hydrolase n=1 Tax=Aspergillus keveii TaxID=714993 RepID=A0ABR4G1Q0_9EURO
MNRLLIPLLLLLDLRCTANIFHDQDMAYRFDTTKPSTNLTWMPCFDDFTCTRLEVPLDYENRSLGTTSIAFMRLAGKNATSNSPSIILIPGGPGGSGIDLLHTYAPLLGRMLGEEYNFVSYDPRGVNNSGLVLDCFSGNTEARAAFTQVHRTGVTNIFSASLTEQFYSASIYGEWCNDAVENGGPDSRYGYYVTTPAAAQDLLSFIEAEARLAGRPPADAKLWAYGVSYGTVVGSTFAAMFPDRVGRMVLDGVLDAEMYFGNEWGDFLDQADETMGEFVRLCHDAGPGRCSFWGPSTDSITDRLDGIIRHLQEHPVPVSMVGSRGNLPTLVTYSDLKVLFLTTIYNPLSRFPSMADALHELERGNVSALVGAFADSDSISDSRLAILCADSYRRNRLTTIEEFKRYAESTTRKSRYIGDIYPIYIENILCPISALEKPTSFPILFASNTIDPITPLKSARTMSSRFAGSVVLRQEAVGHTVVLNGASDCYWEHVRAYLRGTVPAANITCPQQYVPFIDGSVGSF